MAKALPPVILLHGCGGSPEQAFGRTGWIAAFEAAGRDVQALPLPGHLRDGPSHDPADYADLTAALLPRLPAGACDLVGFSLGAKLALDIAVRHPQRVHRMVLGGIGDNAFAPESVGAAAAQALEQGRDADTPAAVLAFLETWDPALNDPLAVAAVLRRPANPVFNIAQIAAIRASVAVVNGKSDFVTAMGTLLVDALGVSQVLLPQVGHFDLPQQAAFRDHAIRFLSQPSQSKD